MLRGVVEGRPCSEIITTTYNHCRDRAYSYAAGKAEFLTPQRGLKITNFYYNLLDPTDRRWVTIDGHVVAAWRALPLTMREATVTRGEYAQIKRVIIDLADGLDLRPNQLQAMIWFARKRSLGIKYDPQLRLFGDRSDVWAIIQELDGVQDAAGSSPR